MSLIVQLQPHPIQLPGGLNRWDIDPLRHGPMDPGLSPAYDPMSTSMLEAKANEYGNTGASFYI